MDELLRQFRDLSPADRTAAAHALQDLGVSPRPSGASGGAAGPRVVQSLYQRKLRLFSGKKPVPSGEVDYQTWHRQVSQLDQEDDPDDSLTELQKKRLIQQSLLRPASDTVWNIGGTSKDILDVLNTVYGSVIDGHELLLQFYTTYQTEKESSSDYVQRLYLLAVEVAEFNGIAMAEVPKHLLEQFIRGNRDEAMLLKLGLESKVDHPPTFATLLLDIRKEEARQTQKRLRLKSTVKVASTSASTSSPTDSEIWKGLQERVLVLEGQLQQRHTSTDVTTTPSTLQQVGTTNYQKSSNNQNNKAVVKGFCYVCGEDGHHAPTCSKPPNPVLVQKKLLKRSQSLNK